MPRKTIYIKDEDASTWEKAEKLLEKGESLSSIISRSLHSFIEQREALQKGMERIEVIVGGGLDSKQPVKKQAFVGKWLVDRLYANENDTYYSVALTQKNNIAVHAFDQVEGGHPLKVYSTPLEAEEVLPTSVFEELVDILGLTEVEELDI
jgi:hypothetical protein